VKKFESEVSTGNMSGKAGVSSIPFNRGFYNYGGNNGASGIEFTPRSEPSFKTYKSMKHSKKKLKNKMKHLKTFEMWTTNVTNDDFIINYGDKKPESKIVSDTIHFINKNIDKIADTNITTVRFKSDILDFNNIRLFDDPESPYINFSNSDSGFNANLTHDEYEELYNFFKKIYIDYKGKRNERDKEEYYDSLMKKKAKKYNL
jgi:hypothetical protein